MLADLETVLLAVLLAVLLVTLLAILLLGREEVTGSFWFSVLQKIDKFLNFANFNKFEFLFSLINEGTSSLWEL